MRIALISQPRDFIVAGGTQRGSVAIVTYELARRLADRHDVTLYAPLGPGQPATERCHETLLIRRLSRARRRLHRAIELSAGLVEWSPPYFVRKAFFREYATSLAQQLRRDPPQVVHIQVNSQFIPLVRQAVPRARIVLHVHDELLTHVARKWAVPNLAHVDAVVTCSDYIARRWRERFPEYATIIQPIGNGVDLERFVPGRADDRAPPSREVLYVGRVSPEKGTHVLASAFNLVVRAVPEARLSIVGPAGLLPLSYIALLAQDRQVASLREFYGRGLLDRIVVQVLGARSSYLDAVLSRLEPEARARTRVFGGVGQERLPELYRRAALLAAPSVLEEPFGLPLVEAMACAVPVVASRAGGMADILEDGVTGRLVERGDVESLAQAMTQILLDAPLADSMRLAACATARQRFGWERVACELEKVYAGSVHAAPPMRPVPSLPRSARRAS
jgi:glycosyltransferase involved in cell wall biosynthesis